MKVIAIMLVVIGLLALLLYVLFFQAREPDDKILGSADTQNIAETPADAPYRSYRNTMLGFSMDIPEAATVTLQGDSRVRVQLLGPDNEPNTEVTDGLTFIIYREPLTELFASAQEYAESVFRDTERRPENEILSTLSARTIRGMEAYRYDFRGALGTVITEYIVLPGDGEAGYRITYSAADPHDRKYEEVAERMLQSMQFEKSAVKKMVPTRITQSSLMDLRSNDRA